MNEIDIKERIESYYRPRNRETENLNEYVQALVKHLESKIGFTKFHNHIWRVFKTFIGAEGGIANKAEWAEVCANITGYEKLWLVAIGTYLTPEQIKENEDTCF